MAQDNNELNLILSKIQDTNSKIDDLSSYVKNNFQELYGKHDKLTDKISNLVTKYELLKMELDNHKADEKESIKKQGERIGAIEGNSVLKNDDRFKWLKQLITTMAIVLTSLGILIAAGYKLFLSMGVIK